MQEITCAKCGNVIHGMALQKAEEIVDRNNNIILTVKHINVFAYNFDHNVKTYCSSECVYNKRKPLAGLLPEPESKHIMLMEYCTFEHPTKNNTVFVLSRDTIYNRQRAYLSAKLITNGKTLCVNKISLIG